jgi:oligopeptide/dipeptide ABC transporter ATP-binding protein
MTPALEARQLTIEIHDGHRSFTPVEDLDVAVAPGHALGIVGESGSGKSLTLRALMGLLPPMVTVRSGEIRVVGEVVPRSTRRRPRATPGAAMVFQEPLGALNPLLRVEDLLGDVLQARSRPGRKATKERTLSLLREVGIPDPPAAMRAYPHQISGGQRQRVMIAMALASEPRVLLCDEPTTALDVTVQQRILRLLSRIRQERDMSLVYVTHDLAVVNEVCDDVAIIYAGQIVESGPAQEVFASPAHPYTRMLIDSVPDVTERLDDLVGIVGVAPNPRFFPTGCRFHPRCFMAEPSCSEGPAFTPRQISTDRATACIHAERLLDVSRGSPDGSVA